LEQHTIQENKDLDLPSEKEMLAMYRCDEIIQVAYGKFFSNLMPIKETLETSIVEKMGQAISGLYNECLGLKCAHFPLVPAPLCFFFLFSPD
jgi:hypothetical protein